MQVFRELAPHAMLKIAPAAIAIQKTAAEKKKKSTHMRHKLPQMELNSHQKAFHVWVKILLSPPAAAETVVHMRVITLDRT